MTTEEAIKIHHDERMVQSRELMAEARSLLEPLKGRSVGEIRKILAAASRQVERYAEGLARDAVFTQ